MGINILLTILCGIIGGLLVVVIQLVKRLEHEEKCFWNAMNEAVRASAQELNIRKAHAELYEKYKELERKLKK